MRVLLTSDAVGGVWTYTKEVATGLLEAGCPVALVNFGPPPRADQLTWCELLASRYGPDFYFEACPAPLEWMPDNDQAYSEGAALLQRILSSFDADILHSSQFCFGSLPVSIPKVVVAHSDVLSWARACRPGALQESTWLTRYQALVQEGLTGADVVVAPTAWMLEQLADGFTLPDCRQVIPNGRTLRHRCSTSTRKRGAISAGRLRDPAKNLACLAEIETDVPIMLIGDTQIHAEFFHRLGAVTCMASLPESDLLDQFCSSAIYLLLSRYEPFGLAPLEAALCGCAILANDTPSAREVWQDAATYFSNPAGLQKQLNRLSRDSCFLEKKQAAAMHRAQGFSSSRMISRYLDLYDLLARAPSRVHEARYA